MGCDPCGSKSNVLTVEQMKRMSNEEIIAAYRAGYTVVQNNPGAVHTQSENLDQQSGEKITNLASTCPAVTKKSGDTVVLNCAPNLGVEPYTVTYYKKVGPAVETIFLAAHTVPENGPDPASLASRTDTLTDADIAGATGDPAAVPPLASAMIRYRISVTDSCPTGGQTCTEFCDVALACVQPTCNFQVT